MLDVVLQVLKTCFYTITREDSNKRWACILCYCETYKDGRFYYQEKFMMVVLRRDFHTCICNNNIHDQKAKLLRFQMSIEKN
jgi:hypothetical protein